MKRTGQTSPRGGSCRSDSDVKDEATVALRGVSGHVFHADGAGFCRCACIVLTVVRCLAFGFVGLGLTHSRQGYPEPEKRKADLIRTISDA